MNLNDLCCYFCKGERGMIGPRGLAGLDGIPVL